MPEDRVRTLIQSGRRKLKAARDKRPAPAVDPTIFASWNGMMIAAVLDAAVAFGRDDVRAFALKSLDRIIAGMWSNEDGMWQASAHGVPKVPGLPEAHAYALDARLTPYRAAAI